MQPSLWLPPVELSTQEEQIVTRIRRARLFVFLRHHRNALFDEAFQRELATLYQPSKRGQQTRKCPLCLAVLQTFAQNEEFLCRESFGENSSPGLLYPYLRQRCG